MKTGLTSPVSILWNYHYRLLRRAAFLPIATSCTILDTTTTTSTAHMAQNIPLSVPSCAAKVKMAAAPSNESTGLEFIMVSSMVVVAFGQDLYPDARHDHEVQVPHDVVVVDHDAGRDRSHQQ